MLYVCSRLGSRERNEPAAACQRLSSLWRLRETTQHQAHSQAPQGTAAPATAQQRRVLGLPQSLSHTQQSQQPPKHLPSPPEVATVSSGTFLQLPQSPYMYSSSFILRTLFLHTIHVHSSTPLLSKKDWLIELLVSLISKRHRWYWLLVEHQIQKDWESDIYHFPFVLLLSLSSSPGVSRSIPMLKWFMVVNLECWTIKNERLTRMNFDERTINYYWTLYIINMWLGELVKILLYH